MSRTALVLTTLLAATATPACADAVADFYAGKQIRFIIRTGSATPTNSYSRLLARHIGRHIPGNPTIIAVNMPGGGGIRAATYVAKIAPQDGTILSIVSQGLPVDQALGLNTTFQADLRDFHWIGNISSSNQVLATWHTSPTKTLADLMKRETVIGSSQAGSISTQLPGRAQQYRRHQDQDRLRLSGRQRHQHRDGARRGRRPRGQSVGQLCRQPAALHRKEADQSDHPDRDCGRKPTCPTWH